jgi:hypothetical protein
MKKCDEIAATSIALPAFVVSGFLPMGIPYGVAALEWWERGGRLSAPRERLRNVAVPREPTGAPT